MESIVYIIGLIFALSIVIVYLFTKLKLPPLLGFFLVGILAGPYVFKLVPDYHQIEILAEIGVILQLFIIGIELSLSKLSKIKRVIFIGGAFQVIVTILISTTILYLLGLELNKSIFLGFLISLSSTAVIMKLLQSRSEIDSPHGRYALGISIFQDLAVIPMLLVIPLLIGGNNSIGEKVTNILLNFLIIASIVILLGRYVVPLIFYQIAKTRIKELFLMTTLLLCLGIVYFFSRLDLSLALGAFIAGLLISESEYNQEAIAIITPFRDVFSSFFFVSIGMLLNIQFLSENIAIILLLLVAVMILKSTIASIACLISNGALRSSIMTGIIVFQIGEFSFVLSLTGIKSGLIDENFYQMFLAVSIISMALTPFMISAAPKIAERIACWKIFRKLASRKEFEDIKESLTDHIIIIGYGLNGQNVAKAAKIAGIPYLILEMNPATVRSQKAAGEPIYYADASNSEILEHCGIRRARVLVIAISDLLSSERIISLARKMNHTIHIIVRTRYVSEIENLAKLGADDIIPEEFETSIEIFTRVLNKYLIPRSHIVKFINEIRASGYEMFRSMNIGYKSPDSLKLSLPDHEITVLSLPEGCNYVGKSLIEIAIREKYSITLLAIKREGKFIVNPAGKTILNANDQLVLFGIPNKLVEFSESIN